jgi:hypothetical protein
MSPVDFFGPIPEPAWPYGPGYPDIKEVLAR